MYQVQLPSKTEREMTVRAKQLREEFLEYVEDLELFANPAFWKSVREGRKPRRVYQTLDELRRDLKLT